MLKHLRRVHIDPAPFRPQPIRSSMDERAIRFELERQACQSLRKVLQLKLQQRRTREELVSQGIMSPLKGSAALPEQRRSLEQERTEDYLKRKIKRRPERTELIRMHIFEETSAERSPQAKQLQLKRARLADDLNEKIACRPGPMELIHKNILPVHSSIKQAIIGTQFPEASGMNSSCDEDSRDSLSPGQPISQDYPLGPEAVHSRSEKLAGSSIPSPTQVHPAALSFPPISESFTPLKLTSGTMASSGHRAGVNSDIKRHKKNKDNKPKIKKLKYHQYIPPDQKGDKEPPPHLDSSYAKILQQQQLFLQLQILSQQQQQQHFNYHTILPAPLRDQKPPSSSCSNSSPPPPAAAEGATACGGSASSGGTKAVSAHPNLDGMKVAELKCELKLRSLPVSGTKNDLIERLRTYQELNQGNDTTSSPTAGGTTGPGPGGSGRSSKATETTMNSTSQEQQFQHHQASSLSADASSSFCPPAATPKQLKRCGGNINSLTPRSSSPAAISPKDISFNSEPLGELMSPLPQLSLQPSTMAQLPANIKEEAPCSTPAPCQFSLKSPSLLKCCLVSSAAPTATAAAPLVTIDKDRMLQEKDKQIAELTRMLRQKQRLVEMLEMQLEHENREATVPQPLILLEVKEEPDDRPFPPQVSSISSEMDIAKVTIKQEAIETEISGSKVSVQSSDTRGLYQSSTQAQQAQNQVQLQLKPEQKSKQKTQEHICLQQTALQLAQQQAIQKILQQHSIQEQHQQQKVQNQIQRVDTQQKLCQQRQKKKLHRTPYEPQKQLLPSHQQPKQQKSVALQQQAQQLQQIQIQTKIYVKQQQLLPQDKPEGQQPLRQICQTSLNQQSTSTPSFSLDLRKSDPTPTLVSDSNGNHFLISLTNHITGNERADASWGKARNHTALQRLQSTPAKLPGHFSVQVTGSGSEQQMHPGVLKQQNIKMQNGVLQESSQRGAVCLTAPPSLQPFYKNQGSTPTGKNTSSPSTQTMSPGLDVLLSPRSPASVKTAPSPPDDKYTENEEDFIDIILQAGEMSTTFRPAPDPSLDCLNPDSCASSPPTSPLHLLLSPPTPPTLHSPQPAPSLQPEPQALADTTEEKQHLSLSESGRLEDFLESTTGKPLFGVEPGGVISLIDDLYSQLLCTPSILDHPPSPVNTIDIVGEGGQRLVSTDWSDISMGEEGDEEPPTLGPLGPQTPLSVFSTDFLDSSDLHMHWGSCL